MPGYELPSSGKQGSLTTGNRNIDQPIEAPKNRHVLFYLAHVLFLHYWKVLYRVASEICR